MKKYMTLAEKMERAKTCASYSTKLNKCARDGYPPFDCQYCTSFKKRAALKEGDEIHDGNQNQVLPYVR